MRDPLLPGFILTVGSNPTSVPKVPQGSLYFSEIVDGLSFGRSPIFRDDAGCRFGGRTPVLSRRLSFERSYPVQAKFQGSFDALSRNQRRLRGHFLSTVSECSG